VSYGRLNGIFSYCIALLVNNSNDYGKAKKHDFKGFLRPLFYPQNKVNLIKISYNLHKHLIAMLNNQSITLL